MHTPRLALLPLFALLAACGDSATDELPAGTSGAQTSSGTGTSSGGPAESSGSTSDAEGSESGSDASTGTPAGCVPPPLLALDDIPDDPSLDYGNDDIVATFEVVGHGLVGKHVTDSTAAEGGLKLWQELTLRIPENQLQDLVQFDIYLDSDPVAYFNRTGNVTTKRLGLKIGFSVENFALNQDDPCAPLEPRRGTFDWSLVHEFGHLRGFVDGSWPLFLDTFPDVQGPGDGYPEDGSPILTGEFVTSYAERADGDEDHAESWTTFVMLASDQVPDSLPGDPLALQKVQWMATQPDLVELRDALRITEPDHVGMSVPAAPALDTSIFDPPGNDDIVVPPELHGEWQESEGEGHHVMFAADDIVLAYREGGVETERLSLGEALAADALEYFEIHGGAPTLAYSYIGAPDTDRFNHDFFLQDDGVSVVFHREVLRADTGELEYLPEVTLTRVR